MTKAFAQLMPPDEIMEPVVALVASVVNCELIPNRNGMRAVVTVCPSFAMQVDKPVSNSRRQLFITVDEITVFVTTGIPDVVEVNVPVPLNPTSVSPLKL